MAEHDMNAIQDKVVQIIAAKLKVNPSTITMTSTLQDLGADSLALVEIVMKLEEQFGIEIDDERAEKLKNVQDVVQYIQEASSK